METLFRRGACHRPSRCTEIQGPTRHGDPLVLYAAGASVCGAANQRPTRHGDVLPVRLKVKLVMVATKQRPTRHRNAVATTKTHPAFSGNEPEADKAWNPRYPADRACSSCFDMAGDGAGFRASEAARSTGRVRSCESRAMFRRCSGRFEDRGETRPAAASQRCRRSGGPDPLAAGRRQRSA